jgi:hypothetical protein
MGVVSRSSHTLHPFLFTYVVEMEQGGISPSVDTFSTILSVLAEINNIYDGRRIHQQIKVLMNYMYTNVIFIYI